MFVGDRGAGVGLRTKGREKSKENIHSKAINACITDERMAPQICLFFKLLFHFRDDLKLLSFISLQIWLINLNICP